MSGSWMFGQLMFFATFFGFAVSFSIEVRLHPNVAVGLEVAGQKLGVAWIPTRLAGGEGGKR